MLVQTLKCNLISGSSNFHAFISSLFLGVLQCLAFAKSYWDKELLVLIDCPICLAWTWICSTTYLHLELSLYIYMYVYIFLMWDLLAKSIHLILCPDPHFFFVFFGKKRTSETWMGFEVHDNALSALCLPSIFHSIAWFYFPSYKFLFLNFYCHGLFT